MIARAELWFGPPGVILGSVNSWNKLVERHRAFSSVATSVFAAVAAFVLATICGFLGAFAATYLYDRANSKGDDLTVGFGGLFAVGTFTFVVAFTWLQKLHHPISSRTPLFAFYVSLLPPVAVTLASLGDIDDHYLPLVLGDWLAIFVLGLLSFLICRRWWKDPEQGF
jgi:ABC-type spermidine/putrescine transport system permease subunit II